MTLSNGTRLGSYEILSPIGAGGMGEVYRAKDTNLDREVAIKVLPDEMARDVERITRFEREAKLLASLNHPNIAAVYGFDRAGDTRFLVLEYVEGATLSKRLEEGPFVMEDGLDVAKQMAEGLEAAHDKGIIHRDLKPANVMIDADGTVKILDFGLAKAMSEDSSKSTHANSPTLTADYTRPGVILGTAAYMSPEQARGRSLDKRTDIWSFGVLLFECLSGATLFRGETATDSMGAILHKDPEWSLLPPNIPPTVQLLLRRCLAKDRKKRLHDIADARVELEQAIEDPTSTSLGLARAALEVKRSWLPSLGQTVILAILLTGVAATAWLAKPEKADDRPVIRTKLELSTEVYADEDRGIFDFSPDGSQLVYVGKSETSVQLYLRRLHDVEVTPLANTIGADTPFFSPDGRWVAFWTAGEIRKVSVLGGPATKICDAPAMRGASWGPDNTIIFAPGRRTGIWRVSANGGQAEQLTELNPEHPKASHRWPFFMPDGKSMLYTETENEDTYVDARIIAHSFDTKEKKILAKGATDPRYIPTGHVLFIRENVLVAMPFDMTTLTVTGPETPVMEDLATRAGTGTAHYAVSNNGLFLYMDQSRGGSDENTLVWVDRAGNVEQASRHSGPIRGHTLSPDGTHIAICMNGATSLPPDIWIIELERDMMTRLTVHDGSDRSPLWSPDQKWIYFSSERETGSQQVWRKRADGTGEAERVATSPDWQYPTSISPDGKMLVYMEELNIYYVHLSGEKQGVSEPFLATQFSEFLARVSPDGEWIAYVSNVTGGPEIYVERFPKGGDRLKISAGPGLFPRWSPDGSEIIYVDRTERKYYSVSVAAEDGMLRAQLPELILQLDDGGYWPDFDLSTDGKRFLFSRTGQANVDSSHEPTLVVNWFEELRMKTSTTTKQ